MNKQIYDIMSDLLNTIDVDLLTSEDKLKHIEIRFLLMELKGLI